MIISTRMSGFGEWERAFSELAARNTVIVRAAARAAANQIVEHIKAKTPVGPPPIHMRDQVFWTSADETGENAISALGAVGNELAIIVTIRSHYARFVEFGTSKMPARPFFRPALDEAMEAAATAMKWEAWETIKLVLKMIFFGPGTIVTVTLGLVWDYLLKPVVGNLVINPIAELVF